MSSSETSPTNTVPAVKGTNTAHPIPNVEGPCVGVEGQSDFGWGVYGHSTSGRGVVAISTNDYGLRAASTKSAGIRGSSVEGRGIEGWATKSEGVVGISTTGTGVWGQTDSAGTGVLGTSKTGTGVVGSSDSGSGVSGSSNSGAGVFGRGAKDAGVIGFHGDPRLQETIVPSAQAGVFGASDVGSGVVAYTRNRQVPALLAQGGLRSLASLNAFAGIFDGNVQVNGDIFVPGADCAEHFDIAAGQEIEPGSVVVIHHDGALKLCESTYDKKVAGVISGAGAYRAGLVLDKQENDHHRQPVALVGKVFCKVDAQYGPVEIGDLLTTSPTPGHAMKASDPAKAFGAVIGKALDNLDSGTGLVRILVCLQ